MHGDAREGLAQLAALIAQARTTDIGPHLASVRRGLLAPTTLQRLCGVDAYPILPHWADYYHLLTSITRHLLPKWPLLSQEYLPLFLPEECFYVVHEVLALLCGLLKTETQAPAIQGLGIILSKFAKSDCVLSATIDIARLGLSEGTELYKQKTEWEDFVQLLTSLPERVANKLERHTPKLFSHERYSFTLVFHIIRCMDFMVDSSYYQSMKYDVAYLSYLLSKTVTNYSMGGSSEAIIKLLDVFISWAGHDEVVQTKFIRKRLVQRLLLHTNRQAIDTISVMVLRKCPINLKKEHQRILDVLGDSIDKNKDWKTVLCYKIPFNTTPQDYKDTHYVENLIYYIASSKNSEEILSDLITRLSEYWGDVKCFTAMHLNHHLFISQALILAVKYRANISNIKKRPWNTQPLKQILFKAISKHLDSVNPEFRAVGMATVEIVLSNLRIVDACDRDTQLKFDYFGMSKECHDIYENLLLVNEKCALDPQRKVTKTLKDEVPNLKDILDFIELKLTDEDDRPINNTIVSCAVKSQDQTKKIVKTIIAEKLNAFQRGKKHIEDEVLDSDDDLQPYDMSNDLPISAKKRPSYLRELIEKINESKDYEEFEACLEVSEELVRNQLRNEDSVLAIELLNLFINLECKFNVDDFDNIRYNTTVAIVCNQPKACAEYLCKEFHTDVGRYSIATKILMLDILAEAAHRLANLKPVPQSTDNKNITVVEKEELTTEEIIRRRLVNKTTYYHSRRPHPFSKATKNSFAPVADSFFYPLVFGFGKKQLTLSHHNMKQDTDNILLLKYLTVVSNIILASKNCPNCVKYCTEVVEILLYLRYNSEEKIQNCLVGMIAAIVLALPSSVLKSELQEPMLILHNWLLDLVGKVEMAARLGATRPEWIVLVKHTVAILQTALAID